LGGIIGIVFLFRLMIKTDFWKKLSSPTAQLKEDGYNSSIGLENLLGEEGTADTDLRPSGWVQVGEKRIFVVTEGSYIDKNETIKIMTVDGNRVVVRKINQE